MDAGRTQAGLPSWFRAAWPAALAGLLLGLLALGPGLGRGFLLSYDMVACHGSRSPRPCSAGAARCPARCRATPSPRRPPGCCPRTSCRSCSCWPSSCWPRPGWPPCWRGQHWLARLAGAVCYALEPVRRRAAHHRPVGAAARLRRAALGAGRGDPARGHLVALGRATGAGLTARGGWRVLRHVHFRAGRAARGRLRAGPVSREAAIGGGGLGGAPREAERGVAPPAQHGALRRLRSAGLALLVLTVLSLPWLVPALRSRCTPSPAGVAAFAARADTPFGALGSLLMLGGAWNGQTVPSRLRRRAGHALAAVRAGRAGRLPDPRPGPVARPDHRRRGRPGHRVHRADQPWPRPAPRR